MSDFLANWVINLLIFTVLLVICKVFSPVFLLGPLPAIMIYWVIKAAAKSGRVGLWKNKEYPVQERHLFSMVLALWVFVSLSGPIVIMASLLKWQYSSIFWGSCLALYVVIYLLLMLFNPYFKKISGKSQKTI
jgi:hypothetical protein